MMPEAEAKRATILVVDDTPSNITLLNSLLRETYRVKLANSGAKALQLASVEAPDLILLDIMMPEMDGFEVCRQLQAMPATKHVPVIFLTAKTQPEDEEMGLSLGAVDFIHKPISPPLVAARIKAHLQVKAWRDHLQDHNVRLQREVELRLTEINHLQDAAINVMASLAEFRDDCSGKHSRRTQEYMQILARQMAREPAYAEVLTAGQILLISKSAPLHDVGKIAVPDHILLKPGQLSGEEFALMQTHAQRGYDILCRAGEHMGEHGHYLQIAKQIAHSHHEKWDGSGYPFGLRGDEIPLPAQMMALVDVFDALTTRRPYKKAWPIADACNFISTQRGSHFAPAVVDAFLQVQPEFARVASLFVDHYQEDAGV